MEALKRACEKLHQQELERARRKECQRIRAAARIAALRKRRLEKRTMDRRLDNWQFYLKKRKIISDRIMKRTGKTPGQVLLNCSSSVQKAMIQRLFDQADRLSPENEWRAERMLRLRTRCGLEYKLPDANLIRRHFMVYGLPEITASESLSSCCLTNWLKSQVVKKRFEEKKFDIYNVITHFPDVGALQVVGTKMEIHYLPEQEKEEEPGDGIANQRKSRTRDREINKKK